MDYPMSIEIEGEQKIQSAIQWYMLQLTAKQRKRHLKSVGRVMTNSMRANVKAGGRRENAKGTWPKLKRMEKPRKSRGRFGVKKITIIHKSDLALQGKYPFLITASVLADAAVMIGFRSKIAEYHERGLGRNPKRQAVMFHRRDRKRIIAMARKLIDREAMKGVR